MPLPDHNDPDLSIYQMVLHRLPFMEDNPTNQSLLSAFTLEVMFELEPCFKVRFLPDGVTEDWTRVGDENNYDVTKRSIIADIVAVYVLLLTAAASTGGNSSTGTAPLTTFLKKAKAGSVEVEYDQFDVKSAAMLGMNADSLIAMYKKAAMRKARNLGCIIDICDDCSTAVEIAESGIVKPFITLGGGCGCC